MVLGVEGYGLDVRELAATLQKTPDGLSSALARGVRRRADDDRFRRQPREAGLRDRD
jgi:hypothetical protein